MSPLTFTLHFCNVKVCRVSAKWTGPPSPKLLGLGHWNLNPPPSQSKDQMLWKWSWLGNLTFCPLWTPRPSSGLRGQIPGFSNLFQIQHAWRPVPRDEPPRISAPYALWLLNKWPLNSKCKDIAAGHMQTCNLVLAQEQLRPLRSQHMLIHFIFSPARLLEKNYV